MKSNSVYPQELRELVHTLSYVKGYSMPGVVAILKKKFPLFADQLTVTKMHSVARLMRKKYKVKVENKAKGHSDRSKKEYAEERGNLQEQVRDEARKLRHKDYTWGAIVKELILKFPEWEPIPPGSLALMVKGNRVYRTKKRVNKENNSNNNKYKLSIVGPSDIVINMDINSTRLEKVVKALLEG